MDLLTFSLDHFDLWRPLAGLGLFLFAMDPIETGLEGASGPSFQRMLRRNTHKPVRGRPGVPPSVRRERRAGCIGPEWYSASACCC